MDYFSMIDFAVDGYAYLSASRAYPDNPALCDWATNGYMVAWREHFLRGQEGGATQSFANSLARLFKRKQASSPRMMGGRTSRAFGREDRRDRRNGGLRCLHWKRRGCRSNRLPLTQ